MSMKMNSQKKAYLVGGGIGSLAAAAFLIRDGGLLRRPVRAAWPSDWRSPSLTVTVLF